MTATVIPLPPRRVPRRVGPVPAVIAASQVLCGTAGPLLELRLKVRLDDIPPGQRRALAGLLRSGDRLALTLATGWGGEGGSRGMGRRVRWVRIPRETGQGFHGKLDTHSKPNWTGIPRETGHLR